MTDAAYLRAATHVVKARRTEQADAALTAREQIYAARLADQIKREFATNPPRPLRTEQIVALRAILGPAIAAMDAEKLGAIGQEGQRA